MVSPEVPSREVRRLRLWFLTAACGLAIVLGGVYLCERSAPWRLLQERFRALEGEKGRAEPRGPEIRQIYTCGAGVDRCTTCHLGIQRKDLVDPSIPLPFRAHGPGLRGHRPERIGCTACHGGNGRALDPGPAHRIPGLEARDPLMGEPHVQAACARCHVPGSRPGQDRLVAGALLYLGLGCALCHPLRGEGRGGLDYGPDLRRIARKDPGYLETSLLRPDANFPGSTMPSFRRALGDKREALTSLVIYLEGLALPRLPACRDRGAIDGMVGRPCADCHAGRRGAASGRLSHRCIYLLRRSRELRCAGCHEADIPPPGPGRGYCPVVTEQRGACAACHEDGGPGRRPG